MKDTFEDLHAELTKQIIGVFFDVANELGSGFMEAVYRRSLLVALRQAGLKAEEEVAVPVSFRGHMVGLFYADIVVEGLIILELKAADEITRLHVAQVSHYLRSTRMEIGYVLLFAERAGFRRVIFTNDRKKHLAATSDESYPS